MVSDALTEHEGKLCRLEGCGQPAGEETPLNICDAHSVAWEAEYQYNAWAIAESELLPEFIRLASLFGNCRGART